MLRSAFLLAIATAPAVRHSDAEWQKLLSPEA
jgi:hypothetical protein